MPDDRLSARLYAVDVSALEDDGLYAAAYRAVSDERREKADRFRFRKDRNLSIGAGLLLQYALRQAGMTQAPVFCFGANGKPYLQNRPDLFFSLSHSGHFALCAVSGAQIGCDIEQVRDCELALAKRFFTAGEYAAIAAQPTLQAQTDRFYRIWTLKESFLKCTGLGLQLPLHEFEITADAQAIRIRQQVDVRSFRFQCFDELPGYQCALCEAEGTGETQPELLPLHELL